MRVLLVTPYYAPAYYFGGPVSVTETLAHGLVDAGHDVTVATTDALDAERRVPAGTEPVPAEASVLRFRNVSHRLGARSMAWTPRGYLAWVREHAQDFDVAQLNDIYSVLSVGAARAAARAGVPYVLQPHGSTPPSRERGRALVKRAFLAAWGRRTLAEASALLASTAVEHRDLVAAGARPDRVVDIPPPITLPTTDGRGPLPATPTVVFLGRFDPIKRIDRVLRAAELVRRRLPDLRVVLVGEGQPVRSELERLASELRLDVAFPGFLVGEEKVRALQQAHVFCMLSRSEGLPIAALEAMACGTPVVVSEACNIPEAHGRAGLVVSGTQESAADAIARVVADDALRAQLAAGAEEFAERYRAEPVLAATARLYESLSAST